MGLGTYEIAHKDMRKRSIRRKIRRALAPRERLRDDPRVLALAALAITRPCIDARLA